MLVRLKCLDNGIGGRSGGWIHPLDRLFGELDGGGTSYLGEMRVGLLDWDLRC